MIHLRSPVGAKHNKIQSIKTPKNAFLRTLVGPSHRDRYLPSGFESVGKLEMVVFSFLLLADAVETKKRSLTQVAAVGNDTAAEIVEMAQLSTIPK